MEVIEDNPLLNGLVDKISNDNNWLHNVKVDGFPQTFDVDSAIIGILTQLKISYGVKPFATKFISDDMISVVQAGLAVSKTFCCTNELRWHLNQIVETGVYKTYLDRVLIKTLFDRPLELEEPPIRALTLYDFKSMFYFLIFGLTLAGLVLLREIFSSIK